MNTLTKRIVAFTGVLALGLTAVKAQTDSALLDALVKKGVLSDREAEDIRANEAKEYAETPAAKLSIGSYIQKLTFYGDGRLRYDASSQSNYNYDSKNVSDRFRYRVRIGAEYAYSDHIKTGLELESSSTDDSGNQTFGATFTKASINVSKIYLQYSPTDWLTADVGKFTNPWYETTDMVYSQDQNPEGAAESFNWTIPLGGGSAPASSDPKDVKAIAPAPSGASLSIGLTAVQYLYVTSAQGTVESGNGVIQNNNNVGIIGAQIPVDWKIEKALDVKIAPGFTFYTGGGNTDYQGGVPYNYTNANTPPEPGFVYGTANSSQDPVFVSPREADDLNVISAPGEVDFKIAKVPVRLYEDFDWNVTGKERVQDVYLAGGASTPTVVTTSPTSASSLVGLGTATGYGSVPTGTDGKKKISASKVKSQNADLGDNVAWATGIQVGQNKKKGDWSGLVEFRQVGLGSVDPNINGTDFANSYSNAEGFKLAAAYNFTDFLMGTVTFYDTWAYKNHLFDDLNGSPAGASANNAAPVADTTQYLVAQKGLERVQVDLGWKF